MARPKKYPDELIQRGVRLALESGRPIAEVASLPSPLCLPPRSCCSAAHNPISLAEFRPGREARVEGLYEGLHEGQLEEFVRAATLKASGTPAYSVGGAAGGRSPTCWQVQTPTTCRLPDTLMADF